MATALSVIVPTYNEAPNIRPLTERLTKACKAAGLELDLLFMDDDSGAGTVETEATVKALQQEGFPVRIHVRRSYEGKGLSSAVLLGFFLANHPTMLCMDADLQHHPEDVPRVAGPVLRGEAEFTVGSRNVAGGQVTGWSWHRKLISWGATLLARPLTPCSDPMSGFFCLTTDVLQRGEGQLNALGFKIALELLVKCDVKKLQEVGITFGDRQAGESKLTMRTNVLYVQHLMHLYWTRFPVLICLLVVALLAALALFAHALLHLPLTRLLCAGWRCHRAAANTPIPRPPSTLHWASRSFAASPPRHKGGDSPKDAAWWWDKFVVCLVFAVAGSSVVFLIRPFIKKVLGVQGSLRDGPNSFRLLYLLLVPPIYSTVLVGTAILFGRRAYFVPVALRLWGRILPKSILKRLT